MLSEKEFYGLFADALRKARKAKGYTFETLAAESETDYSTVNLIENNKQQPKAYTLYRLFYALGIDIEDFIGGADRAEENVILSRLKSLDSDQLAVLSDFLNTYRLSKK